MVGIIIQVMDDGLWSPSSMFFICVSGQVIITGNKNSFFLFFLKKIWKLQLIKIIKIIIG